MTGANLDRRLGVGDAVVIGLGSMVGAGVFAAFGPAYAAAGPGLLIGLLLAGAVAYCNAVSSAQLAAQYPVSGGTYVYGRERLGEWWGFAAGWCFVTGKTASCAAMALTFGSYAAPSSPLVQRVLALFAVGLLTFVTCRGVTRTAQLTRVIVTVSLLLLAITAMVLYAGADGGVARLRLDGVDAYGVLQSAGCCSSRSPVTPGSRQWARRCATPPAQSPEPFRSPWLPPCWCTW